MFYRRHTNFAIESIKNIFNGTTNFGNEISTIDRSGDLIHKQYLQITIPAVDLAVGTSGESGQYINFPLVKLVGSYFSRTCRINWWSANRYSLVIGYMYGMN